MWEQTRFKQGDIVVHARRPEWGDGIVDQATTTKHEGRTAQRLIVRFAHRGRVTVNTAVAAIQSKDQEELMASTSASAISSGTAGPGWLESLTKEDTRELWTLPEAMTDPFSGMAERLRATLDSYRFRADARGLIEWAVAQSGLTDPLSKHNRHELEQAFVRFARDRDRHLGELVRLAKKQNRRPLLEQLIKDMAGSPARHALERAMAG